MTDTDRLYQLLPAVYRQRDAAEGYPLRALLGLISSQADLLKEDIQRLWDNFFIETCDRWVIPYLGDLIGNRLLHDAYRTPTPDTARSLFPDLVEGDLRPPMAIPLRADVAKTIYYRRRKGTLPMLEELARDVTGWPAHAVAFFELLECTQFVRNHLRLDRPATLDLHRIDPLDRLNGPFDSAAHTVDVRPINPLTGWYNIKNIGFFVWRLMAHPYVHVRARPASQPWRFHFSPLGNPAPLFSRWRREGDEAGLATEWYVPAPIRRAFFYEDLERYRNHGPGRPPYWTDLYGPFTATPAVPLPSGAVSSFFIEVNGQWVDPTLYPNADVDHFVPQIVCRRLDPWPAAQPSGRVIGIDVECGRIAFGSDWSDAIARVDVCYHAGCGGNVGGGPYERGCWLVKPELAKLRLTVQEDGPQSKTSFTSLADALTAWKNADRPDTIITILDNATYAGPLAIELVNQHWLVIEAANKARPHLLVPGGEIVLTGGGPDAELTLSGLLIEGAVHVQGELGRLRLLHSTLVPGRGFDEQGNPLSHHPSLLVDDVAGSSANTALKVQVAFSITGPIQIPAHCEGLWLLDAIVDGLHGWAIAGIMPSGSSVPPIVPSAPATTLERTTVFGPVSVKELPLASESIVTGSVHVRRRQQGCVRFSYVPPADSNTPRRYRCQPDLEIAAALQRAEQAAGRLLTPAERKAIRDEVSYRLVPSFTSQRYGQPGYAQLHLHCPAQIRLGAEDGSEMGVYCFLKQPQREANLRLRLQEYLPVGLDPGIIYVT